MPKKTIGIDCRLGGIAHAGIGRYVSELVKRVTKSTQEYNWVLFCNDQAQAVELIGSANHRDGIRIALAPIQQYSLEEQFTLPQIYSAVKIDLLHVPHFNVPILYTKPLVVTIHDLLWHEYRGNDVTTLNPLMYWPKYWAYRFVTKRAVEKAEKIFAPTIVVQDTIRKYYPEVAQKVVVTYEGIGTALTKQAPLVRHVKRKKRHLLYVGSLYPHKNITLVLQALQKMPAYILEIVGSRNVFQERVRAEVTERGLEGQVVFSGRISDVELAERYASASALIQPSLSEGFGLTGLEALAFKTPVLASDIPIFHEVYRDAAIFFDPYSPDSFIAAVEQSEKTKVQAELERNGNEVQKMYSWDKLTKQTLAGYAEVLQNL